MSPLTPQVVAIFSGATPVTRLASFSRITSRSGCGSRLTTLTTRPAVVDRFVRPTVAVVGCAGTGAQPACRTCPQRWHVRQVRGGQSRLQEPSVPPLATVQPDHVPVWSMARK